jgi:hypothetical protein
MAGNTIDMLRHRVEALGHNLIEGTGGDLLVVRPKFEDQPEALGLWTDEENDVEAWCAGKDAELRGHDPETVKASGTEKVLEVRRNTPANEWLDTDFNCPPVAEKYERFLSLPVAAGLKDRLRARRRMRSLRGTRQEPDDK